CLWGNIEGQNRSVDILRELSHKKLGHSYYGCRIKEKKDSVNKIVLQELRKQIKLSFEEDLHIQLMNCDEEDSPWRLLSFLEAHYDAFTEPGLQTLLIVYLYHRSTTKVLETHPLFVEKLKKQVLRAYEIYEQNEDITTAAFFMHYLKRIEGRYEEISPGNSVFNGIDCRQKLLELQKKARTLEEQSSVALSLGLLHYQGHYQKKPFTKELALDVLKASFTLHGDTFSNSRPNLLYSQEIEQTKVAYRLELATYFNILSPHERNEFLNEIIQGRIEAKQWRGSFPDYSSEDGLIELNAFRGVYLFEGKKARRSYPIESKNLEQYGLSRDTLMDGQGCYYSSDRQKRLKDSRECQHQFNGEWKTFNKLEGGRLKSFLASVGLNDVEGYYLYKGSVSSNTMMTKVQDEKYLLILADTQGNPLYEAEVELQGDNPKNSQYLIKAIRKLFDQESYRLVDLNQIKNQALYQNLSFLQYDSVEGLNLKADAKVNHLTIWVSDNDKQVLEINQGALSFKKIGESYASLQYPGYTLAYAKEETLFGFMDYIHLIQPDSQKEKVVIVSPDKAADLNKLQKSTFFNTLSFDDHLKVFDLDKQGRLVVKSSKDSIWVAHVALLGRDYEAAARYLARAEEMGISEDLSLELLAKISQVKDNHPDAISCRMQATCLMKKNALLYGVDQTIKTKQELAQRYFLPDLYVEYLATLGKGKIPPIDISLEKLLWRNLSKEFLAGNVNPRSVLKARHTALNLSQSSDSIEPIHRLTANEAYTYETRNRVEGLSQDFIPPDLRKGKVNIIDKNLLPYVGAGKHFRAYFFAFYNEALEQSKQQDKPLLERIIAM
ncbi:MAG: hypothetical protein WCG10_07595, partial [Chlamydiota bacterium]